MKWVTWAIDGIGVLVVLAVLWSLDHAQMVRDEAVQKADNLAGANSTLEANNAALANALADRMELQKQLAEVGRTTQRLNASLDTQSDLINRNFAELKSNDKAISDYLNNPVPAALGLRYARPETTDPAAYRAATAGMQSGAVSSAGAPTAGAH